MNTVGWMGGWKGGLGKVGPTRFPSPVLPGGRHWPPPRKSWAGPREGALRALSLGNWGGCFSHCLAIFKERRSHPWTLPEAEGLPSLGVAAPVGLPRLLCWEACLPQNKSPRATSHHDHTLLSLPGHGKALLTVLTFPTQPLAFEGLLASKG